MPTKERYTDFVGKVDETKQIEKLMKQKKDILILAQTSLSREIQVRFSLWKKMLGLPGPFNQKKKEKRKEK